MKTPPITSPYAPDLSQVRGWLEKMIKALKFIEVITAVVSLISRMCEINTELTKQLANLRRKRPRSERLEWLERQLSLPLGQMVGPPPAKQQSDKDKNKDDKAKSKRGRRGRHPGRAPLPAHLERIEYLNPVPPELCVCPRCDDIMPTLGYQRCGTLDVVPAKVIVRERVDETVACLNDDTIVSAPVPPAIVARGKLGDTLIIEATCDKYLEHVPIERQCSRFQKYGVDVAPQTLRRSVAAHIDLLMPVARLIEQQTRGPGLLGTDSTGIPVLDPAVNEGIRTGAMWCWTNARWVSFFYSASADSDSAKSFLGPNLARTVQCDGTSVTNFIERAGGKRPGCWSHARRRFVEAARSGDQIALEGLHKIAAVFRVERESKLSGETAEERRMRREQQTRPILDDLHEWVRVHRGNIPPKTPLGKALGYLHRQWSRLLLLLEDGNIEATNNRRERELRRLVLGRKNWLFTWLDVGGERTAAVFSIVATCIAHDVNPRAYLHLITKLIVNGWLNSRLRDLLPDRILVAHPELYAGDPSPLPASLDAFLLATSV